MSVKGSFSRSYISADLEKLFRNVNDDDDDDDLIVLYIRDLFVVHHCPFLSPSPTPPVMCHVPGSEEPLADSLAHLVGAIRENITVSRAQVQSRSHFKAAARK